MADYPAIHGIKGNYKYTAYLPYYPTRFDVSEDLQTIRQYVWNFKDGAISKQVAEILAGAVVDDLSDCQPRNNWWLCVIPASTSDKTQNRFQEFCSEFCRLSGFNNGYHLITNSDDREAIHTGEDRNAINILEYMAFGDVRGKNIILFDDIYTTGKSFLNVASKLNQLGAAQVRGLFLGKTHWFSLVDTTPLPLSAVSASREADEKAGLRVIDEPIGLAAELVALEKGTILPCCYIPKSVKRVELESDDDKANLVIYNAKFCVVIKGSAVEFSSSLSKKVEAALRVVATQILTAKRSEISGRPAMDVSIWGTQNGP